MNEIIKEGYVSVMTERTEMKISVIEILSVRLALLILQVISKIL